MTRTPPEVFDLPVDKIRSGYYSDAYFNHTRDLLIAQRRYPTVVMQVFQKKNAILGGIDEAVAILKECTGLYQQGAFARAGGKVSPPQVWAPAWRRLRVTALEEGDSIEPFEPVMHIEGPYHYFANLETVYLGVLSRRTMVATNVTRVMKAANEKPIFFFPARHDHWHVQTGDGFIAHRVGCAGVSTDAQASWWGGRSIGTVPHALIAAYRGDTVSAAYDFAERYHHDMNITVLVDFDNNSAATAVEVARELGPLLWGVRLDTSERLVDSGLWYDMDKGQLTSKPTGVTPDLVRFVRDALDVAGYNGVKIVVSGGFTPEKIEDFERAQVPVDAYGVGASLIRGDYAYTADIVKTDGEPSAKAGRRYIVNTRLREVDWD